jgi:hypothetical protein
MFRVFKNHPLGREINQTCMKHELQWNSVKTS